MEHNDDILTWRGVLQLAQNGNPAPPRRMEISDAQWQVRLTPEQFYVTRQHGTERAHSSDMCTLFQPGRYSCVCCGTELFDASTKFDSQSGWPSFTQTVAPNVVAYTADHEAAWKLLARCDAWLPYGCQAMVIDANTWHTPDGPCTRSSSRSRPSSVRSVTTRTCLLYTSDAADE